MAMLRGTTVIHGRSPSTHQAGRIVAQKVSDPVRALIIRLLSTGEHPLEIDSTTTVRRP